MINAATGDQPFVLVKLFATLRDGRGKTVNYPWHETLTTGEIIAGLDIPVEEVSILLVNGRTAPLERIVTTEDYLSIFPPVGGG